MLNRIMPALTLTAACWVVFGVNNLLLGGALTQHGIVPRHPGSLLAVLWAPFIHGSYQHLTANTVPLLVLGVIICGRSKTEFVATTVAGVLVAGGLTWLFGRSASHVGASGLIFCFFGYLASLAYFRRTVGALILSAICIVAYGGLLRGVMPTSAPVSWEGHAAGLVTGVAMGWLFAKLKPARNAEDQGPLLG